MGNEAKYKLNLEHIDVAYRAALELNAREVRRGETENFISFQWPKIVLDDFQRDIINHAFDQSHREIFIKGCTKPGKGFAVSMLVNMWFDVYPQSKIILTGPSTEHVVNNLFGEVVSLRKKMRFPGIGEILTAMIKDGTKHYVTIANPKSGEGFSGQHSSHTLFVYDEASVAEDWMYDNSRKQSRMIVALSNPRTLSGWFRKGFGDADINRTHSIQTNFGKRRLITVGGEDCRNVREHRLEMPFAPKGGITIKKREFAEGELIPDDFYEHVKPVIVSQLDYARYLDIMSHPEEFHRNVFGKGWFPSEDALKQIILPSWITRHTDAWDAMDGLVPVSAFGLDVAASESGDETILTAGGVMGIRAIHPRRHADVMETAGWVLDTCLKTYDIDLKVGQSLIAIDYGGGYGRGVGDRLKELGCSVLACHPSKRSAFPNQYEDLRTELYGEMGNRLNPQGPWAGVPWALPHDALLHEDFCAQEKIISSDGVKYKLIPKERPHRHYKGPVLEDKIGRSPDRGDATVLLYHAVRRQESIPDISDRELIIDLKAKDEMPVNETESEKLVRMRAEDWKRLEEKADAESEREYEFGF